MNIKRMAEVWLDDYKRVFYLIKPELKVCYQYIKAHRLIMIFFFLYYIFSSGFVIFVNNSAVCVLASFT